MPTIEYVHIYADGTILTPDYPNPTPNSVSIGPAGGITYGDGGAHPTIIKIEPLDATKGAGRIEGVENDPTTNRDQLNFSNCKITLLDGAYMGKNIAIEFKGLFGPTPEGSSNFGGFLKGSYKRGAVAMPPPYYTRIDGSVTRLTAEPQTYPLPPQENRLHANFNVQFPATPADMQAGNDRHHYMVATFRFNAVNDRVEIAVAGGRIGVRKKHEGGRMG